MGYRSNVYVAIRPDSYEHTDDRMSQLKLLVATRFKDVHDMFGEAWGCTWEWGARRLDIEIRDVKWYPSYDDVRAFEAFLEELVSLKYCAQFIAVGEDNEITQREYGEVWDPLLTPTVSVERI